MSKNFCVFRVFRGLKRTFMNNSGYKELSRISRISGVFRETKVKENYL